MTGDLGGFDCAATDLLAPRHVGSAEGVRPKLGEAAAFGFSSRGGASQVRYDLRRARMGRTGQRLRSVSETFALKGSRFVIAPCQSLQEAAHGFGIKPTEASPAFRKIRHLPPGRKDHKV